MTYLAGGIQQRLQQAFVDTNILLNMKSDHIVLENSQNQTEEKIRQIIESVKFCPLISKIDNHFVFTIVPYKIPEFFIKHPVPQIEAPLSPKIPKEGAHYFGFDEISYLLKGAAFVDEKEDAVIKDRWLQVNRFRTFVSSALNSGLSEIISKHAKNDQPIIEIGSGIGYTLSERLSPKTIRTQPNYAECKLLSKSISDPIYKMDIEGICNCLLESGKKVSLFFALDVFDVLSPRARKTSFLQISQLQNTGDRILILLDTNPCLNVTVEHLEFLYPEHAVFPYFPLTDEPTKFSVILVPLKDIQHKLSPSELIEMINRESMAIGMTGQATEIQYGLHQLQGRLDLKVIDLEEFFSEQVKKELEQAGYKAAVYYHTSFTTGDPPKGVSKIAEDLVYKPVTDMITLRQWCLTDERLLDGLNKKGLNLPAHFNEEFLYSLRKNSQKIFGAEVLVIEATKA